MISADTMIIAGALLIVAISIGWLAISNSNRSN